MKTIFIYGCLVSLFLSVITHAQQINKAEYFIDTDPGIGNGTNIPGITVGDSIIFNGSINLTGLSAGFHRLAIRVRYTTGQWSLYESRVFYIYQNVATSNYQITKAEYFIDTDPGVGNGTSINTGANADSITTNASVNLTGLSAGFHRLAIRAKGTNGQWGMYEPRVFYIFTTSSNPSTQVVAAEYFIDTDPGLGNGTNITPITAGDSISVTPFINLTGLPKGFHRLAVRVKNSLGQWSLYESRVFYINDPAELINTAKITDAEYFFDTDPGVGLGTVVTPGFIAADSIDILRQAPVGSLPAGIHTLNVRVKDEVGSWSFAAVDTFVICSGSFNPPSISVNGNTSSTINACDNAPVTLDAGSGFATYLWSNGATTQTISVPGGTATSYSVTVTAIGGCGEGSDTVIVVPIPAPPVPTITQNLDELTASGSGSFQWYLNGAPITGATNATYTMTQNGTYTVVVTSANGCSSTSQQFVVTNVGIHSLSVSNGLMLFPNPSEGANITIQLMNGTLLKTIRVSDISGRVVFEEQPNQYRRILDLSAFPKGMYLIEVINEEAHYAKRLVIQ